MPGGTPGDGIVDFASRSASTDLGTSRARDHNPPDASQDAATETLVLVPVLKQKTPTQYGAPAKFLSFRREQFDAIRHGVESSRRFIVQAMPTGSGKSLNAIVQALATSSRAAYLTSTKGLQDQLLDDFAEIGLTDVRGQSNYRCIEANDKSVTVDEGPCHFGYACNRVERVRRDGTVYAIPASIDPCLYFDAMKHARDAELVITNYAYWMNTYKYSDGLGDFDLLILDEAHNVVDELSNFLSVEITAWEIEVLLGWSTGWNMESMNNWRAWARLRLLEVDQRILEIKASIASGGQAAWSRTRKHARDLKRVRGKLDALAESSGDWVCESSSRAVRFDIVWPQDYAEDVLFHKIPRVLLLSATVRPKTAQMLGIPGDDLDFREYPHTFPASNRPTYCVDTVRLSSKSTPADYTTWVRRIDQIINARQDRKGVIHTGSYARRDMLLAKSDFAHMMLTHSRRDTARVVERFQQSTAPQILVSPSVTTGYDFPGSQCEYQIIGKVPFPDMRPAVMAARKKRDPEYDSYIAMQQIVQAAGRGVRAIDDRCEVFIIDNHFADWFLWANKHLCPKWFVESVEVRRTIPKPPKALRVVS